ncbi:MAG: hypothetical protein EAY75_18265 [Bacteroidetes bacterium]|nr:MAG: hypothetical protein EAY75_18265 [Bacteroidota bacterium]
MGLCGRVQGMYTPALAENAPKPSHNLPVMALLFGSPRHWPAHLKNLRQPVFIGAGSRFCDRQAKKLELRKPSWHDFVSTCSINQPKNSNHERTNTPHWPFYSDWHLHN